MSEAGTNREQGAVRLRRPERRQVAMVIQCADDLVSASRSVRMVMAVAEHLDLSGSHEADPVAGRSGGAQRDRPMIGAEVRQQTVVHRHSTITTGTTETEILI